MDVEGRFIDGIAAASLQYVELPWVIFSGSFKGPFKTSIGILQGYRVIEPQRRRAAEERWKLKSAKRVLGFGFKFWGFGGLGV